MALSTFGSFHVGGRAVTLEGLPPRRERLTNAGVPADMDPNGVHWVESMYVQYFVPQPPRMPLPLLLWHGGALTGACWETTPDGREGWLPGFVRRGWTTLCCDAVERGRAGFPPVPQVFGQPPLHMPMGWAFERHRIGSSAGSWHMDASKRKARAETRFPVAAYDRFAKQIVPRWTNSDAAILRGYLALLDEVGPCCVLAHSQGCQFAMLAAEARPEFVRALVLLEPSGIGSPGGCASWLNTELLLVYGDGIAESDRWRELQRKVDAYLEPRRQAGGGIDRLELPCLGVHGNSHMLMQDDNSDDIAERIHRWLAQRPLPAQEPRT